YRCGGEGTGMLTAGGGETGAAAVVGAAVVVVPGADGRVAGVAAGAAVAGMNPPETFTAVG
ncbi:MAG: hypothetical protein MIO88_04020, partial [Methanoregulaceae archaeon]|nr:hypothetical protein [Methanoregulaceae archaeon]